MLQPLSESSVGIWGEQELKRNRCSEYLGKRQKKKMERMGNEHEQEQVGRGEQAEEAKSKTIRRIQSGAGGTEGSRINSKRRY